MAPRVVVLDYGSGNLRSAQRALERVGASVTVTSDLAAAREADGLAVPGVGAYAACMAGIDALGAGPVVADRIRDGRPVLGICVGMQVLFAAGIEGTAAHGSVETKGLGLLPGTVTRLTAPVVPHMGWNTVDWPAGSRLGAGTGEGTRFYFVHSYAAPPVVDGALVATTVHGGPFAAAVEHGVLSATQFHPEKSGDAGAALLANWVGTL
jgi:imidazole glycerol-phosphate synthase subunit HisH